MIDFGQRWLDLWKRRGISISLISLALLCCALYANTLDNDFVLDDNFYIVDNHVLRDLGNVWQFINVPPDALVEDMPPGFLRGRNLRWLTYAVDYALGGGRPFFFHLSNLLWHILVTSALFFFVRIVSRGTVAAFSVAALFAAHPVQTAAVSYISGRKDILAAFFVLMAFCLIEKYRVTHHLWLGFASAAMFVMGFFSKESAVVFPLLLLWTDWCRQERLTARSFQRIIQNHWRQYLLLFAIAGVLAVRTVGVESLWQLVASSGEHLAKDPAVGRSEAVGLLENRSYANLTVFYVAKLVWPFHLLADYRGVFDFSLYPPAWGKWLSPLIVSLCAGLAVLLQRWRPLVAIGFGWMLLALLPVSHLIPFHYPVAEHYLYLPSIGFCLMMVNAVQWPGFTGLKTFLLVLVLVIFSITTVLRNGVWQNMETMTADILRKAPAHKGARNTLVHLLIERGDYRNALVEGELAAEQDPSSAINHYNLGIIHAEMEQFDEAERHYRQALLLQPNLWDAYLNLGDMLLTHGRVSDGLSVIDQLTRLYGYHPLALWVLGNQKAREGAWAEARSLYLQQINMDKHSAAGYLGLAGAAWHLGQQDWHELLVRSLEKGLDVDWAKEQEPWRAFLTQEEVQRVISTTLKNGGRQNERK